MTSSQARPSHHHHHHSLSRRHLINLRTRQTPRGRVVDVVDLVRRGHALILALLPQALPRNHDGDRALGDEVVGE
jgi:hypothetical protein